MKLPICSDIYLYIFLSCGICETKLVFCYKLPKHCNKFKKHSSKYFFHLDYFVSWQLPRLASFAEYMKFATQISPLLSRKNEPSAQILEHICRTKCNHILECTNNTHTHTHSHCQNWSLYFFSPPTRLPCYCGSQWNFQSGSNWSTLS